MLVKRIGIEFAIVWGWNPEEKQIPRCARDDGEGEAATSSLDLQYSVTCPNGPRDLLCEIGFFTFICSLAGPESYTPA